ncbi:MAG: hypothetical protein IPL61_26945 [Myxococcales bacterium]|nr:hypothetical protein [Myxococcales bacterium]
MTGARGWAALAALALGCGGGPGDLLERVDVADLPPGDATGADATGSYDLTLYTSACAGRCTVKVGSFTASLCDVGEVDHGGADVTQTDGRLVLDTSSLALDRLAGGLDGDGTFVVGGWGTQQGGAVEVLIRADGALADGAITGVATARAHGAVDGQAIDCTSSYEVTGARAP